MSRFLLDTNVIIWLLAGDRRSVSSRARVIIDDDSNTLLVSAVSVWEIAIKRSLGKLDAPDGWFQAILALDAETLPVSPRHAKGVEDLPTHHRDPFDRLLISQAVAEEVPIITPDSRFPVYPIDPVW